MKNNMNFIYRTHIRKELVFISKEAFETFSCMENFILEYLKHFTHIRTGMLSVIASSLANAACHGESMNSGGLMAGGGRELTSINDCEDSSMKDDDTSSENENDDVNNVEKKPGWLYFFYFRVTFSQ